MSNRFYVNNSVPGSGQANPQIMYQQNPRGQQPFYPPQRHAAPQGMPPRQRSMLMNTPLYNTGIPTYHMQQPWQQQVIQVPSNAIPVQQYPRHGVPQHQYAMNTSQASQFGGMAPASSPYHLNPGTSVGHYYAPGSGMEYLSPAAVQSSSVTNTTDSRNVGHMDEQQQQSPLNFYQQTQQFQMQPNRPSGQGPDRPKEKKIIRIQDPNTMADVTDDVLTQPQAVNSARATPVPDPPLQPADNFAAIFAAKVAAVAVEPREPRVVHTPQPPPQVVNTKAVAEPTVEAATAKRVPSAAVVISAPPPVIPQTDSHALVNKEPICDEIDEPSSEERVSSDPNSVTDSIDSTLTSDNKSAVSSQKSDVESLSTPSPSVVDEITSSDVTESDRQINVTNTSDSSAAKVTSVETKQKSSSTNTTSKHQKDEISVEPVIVEPVSVSVEKCSVSVHVGDGEKATSAPLDEKVAQTPGPKPEALAPQPKAPSPQPEAPAPRPEAPVSQPEAPVVADLSSEVRDKKSKRQKMKELNEKGKSKEGTDMDLFTQSEDVPTVSPKEVLETQRESASSPVVTPTPEAQKPLPVIVQVNDVKDEVNHENCVNDAVHITADETSQDELAKVQEKNEKNERQSEQSKNPNDNDSTQEQKRKEMVQKYKYKEDQWSPLNPEGKRFYDRDFLLSLQSTITSKAKPDGLPKLPDVILDKPIPIGPMTHLLIKPGSSVDFTPGFVRPTFGNPNQGGRISGSRSMDKNRSQQRDGRKEMPPKKVIDVQILQVKLHQAENAWKSKPKSNKTTEEGEGTETEILYKKVRSILNKLTPQKFQTLTTQMMDLKIDTEDKLRGVIDLIFEKAIDEPNFSVPYAHMCQRMFQLKLPVDIKPRVILLNRCQAEFQKDLTIEIDMKERQKKIDEAETEEKKKELQAELDYAYAKFKRRSIGNIRFIGELFKLSMLTENIMHLCIVTLMKSNDGDNLECLCRLMTTVGKELDHEKGKARMVQYFDQMVKITKNKKISSRTRFMLQDVMELRSSNWVPRRVDNNPKTIDQIHREAAKEDAEKAILNQMVIVPQANKKNDRRGPRQGGQSQEEGWKTVTQAKNIPIDVSKMKLKTMDENSPLGPGGRPGFSWSRGSSGGGKVAQEPERPANTPTNRFSALSQSESGSYDSRGRGGLRGPPVRSDMKGRTPQPMRGKFPRYSQEQEKEAALAAARYDRGYDRSISSGGLQREGTGSRQGSRRGSRTDISRESSRENSRTRVQESETGEVTTTQPTPPPVQKPAVPEMDEAAWEKKTKAILDEFLHIQDLKEAILCVQELTDLKSIHYFVSSSLNHVLERSQQARKLTGHLLHDVVSKKHISVENYLKGLHEVLECAEDMEIDIPKIWEYLGELIGPMIQDGSVPLSFLQDAVKPVGRKAGTLMAAILHNASHRLGLVKVGEMWRKSGLEWKSFLGPSENIEDFITKHKLEFTTEVEVERPKDPMAIEEVSEKLRSLLVTKVAGEQPNLEKENEKIFDWIEVNVGESKCREPKFIRALMTEVCSSVIEGSGTACTINGEYLKARGDVLQKYLDHHAELELQSLYALQALVHKLEHPPGLLQKFCDVLYDEDIISEDAFYQWETSSDPAEQEGKGVALKLATRFFYWLRHSEQEALDS